MPSTIKLQESTASSMDSLLKTMNQNTAKQSAKESLPAKNENPESGIQTVTTSAEKKSSPNADELAKVGVCFNVPRYIRDMWKTYFTTHGLTMTEGLIQAVNYLKEQEELGAVKLGAISIIKN